MSKTPLAMGNRYHFHTTEGVNWATSGNLGAQIVNMAMSGGTMRVGVQHKPQRQGNAINPQLGFLCSILTDDESFLQSLLVLVERLFFPPGSTSLHSPVLC